MDWQNLPSGGNIEDRRGGGVPGGGLAVGGIGGLVIALIAMFLGINPSSITGGSTQNTQVQSQGSTGGANDQTYQFVDKVEASNDQVWSSIFQQSGKNFQKPSLVLYTGGTQSGCGTANSAVGPFYCPSDGKIYLDTSFFNMMKSQLGGGGTFAYSYVIAHEYGHHIQNLLGISDQVERKQQNARSEAEANTYSVRLELQADCFAGVWGNHVKDQVNLNESDVQTAINTAKAIGDDTLQRQSQGTVMPDKFTHGSSQQRVNWFMKGYQSGNPNSCDTFGVAYNQL